MMRNLKAWLMATVLLPVSCIEGTPNQHSLADLFTRGNAEYQRGDYASAEKYYNLMLSEGVDSGALYYNLGNVCFKERKLGEAIYFWENAQRRLPGDPDVRENLELANLMVVDRMEVPTEPFPLRVIRRTVDLLPVARATWTVLFLFVAANILFSVYLLAKNQRLCFQALTASLIGATLVLFLGCLLAWRIYDQDQRQEGIVVEQKVDVRSGPGVDNITVFTIHEGIKVRVRGETNGWYQVSLPNGWNGWLQSTALRVLS